MAKKAKVGSFVVRMKCVVTKDVVVQGCTEQQARGNPWDFSTDEHEVDQDESEVLNVTPID